MKGEGNSGFSTHICIPFSSSSSMKGAYMCLSSYETPPSYLSLIFTTSKRSRITKKYEFPHFEGMHWYFLPVDLSDIIKCEIEGKGGKKEYFNILSLVFCREESSEESMARKIKEQLWVKSPIVKSEFIKEGDKGAIPIPRDDPKVVKLSLSMVKCKVDSFCKESDWYDQSLEGQNMLKGESFLSSSYLSIPFPSPSPMKGAYICLDKDSSSPFLLFTFTDSDGKKTSKKYEFTQPKHEFEWHFLPIDLLNVVLCEIEGKGTWCDKKKEEEEDACQMSPSTDAVIQTVESEFVHKGDRFCCPISGDAPNIKSAEFPTINAKDETNEEVDEKYDQSSNAQKMMKGEYNNGHFTHISIPFSSSSPMRGAYILLSNNYSWYGYPFPPSHLIFTLTSSKGDKTSKKYEFHEIKGGGWYFLPVDLPDVVLCEITGKGRKEEYFRIFSLVFICREEIPEEIAAREAREKLWSEAPVVKPEFVKERDRDSIPIPRDDPKLVDPLFSMVKCKDDVYSKESEEYDQSSKAQKMLKGERGVSLSHLSIPFPSPSPMKGAYICVDKNYCSPSLLFTFTDCDGKKTFKKYEFTRPKHKYECHFLPIDLYNVVLCEIEGKGTWERKNSRYFRISSLVFIRGYDIPKFICKGNCHSCPIPRDSSNIKNPKFELTKAKDQTKKKLFVKSTKYDQTSNAQKMLKGEYHEGSFTKISIPFSSSSDSPLKGAYLCLHVETIPSPPPSHLIFTLTSSKGDKTSKKYEFPGFEDQRWYFLPVDLPDVVLCEITGKGRKKEYFGIESLVFISREETPEEIASREAREKLWSEAPVVKPEFVKEGDEKSFGKDSIPIPRDDPKLVDPSFSMVKCKNDSKSKESKGYDRSSEAQKMLKGEDDVLLSHLSIPFPSPSPMKGAY
ncbi:hypothetical protein ADUPG1_006180, partial [Aduncisulcus paluster]